MAWPDRIQEWGYADVLKPAMPVTVLSRGLLIPSSTYTCMTSRTFLEDALVLEITTSNHSAFKQKIGISDIVRIAVCKPEDIVTAIWKYQFISDSVLVDKYRGKKKRKEK